MAFAHFWTVISVSKDFFTNRITYNERAVVAGSVIMSCIMLAEFVEILAWLEVCSYVRETSSEFMDGVYAADH